MRHHNAIKKLSRTTDQRGALIRSLMVSLIRDKRINTTLTKAKAMQGNVEKLITLAKKADLASRRLILSRLANNQEATAEICDVVAPSFTNRSGGYTRIIKNGLRKSDGAPQVIIEFVS